MPTTCAKLPKTGVSKGYGFGGLLWRPGSCRSQGRMSGWGVERFCQWLHLCASIEDALERGMADVQHRGATAPASTAQL